MVLHVLKISKTPETMFLLCCLKYLSSALRSFWLLAREVSFPDGAKFEVVERAFLFHFVVETAVLAVDLKELELAPVPIPHSTNAKSLISRKKKQIKVHYRP